MCRIVVVLLLASFVLEPMLADSSVSTQPTDIRAGTRLLVLPDTIIGSPESPPAVGDTFIDSIYVDGVDDLYGWQIYLTFNPVVLNGIELIEGPFLKQGGQTFFIPPCEGIDNSTGMITLCCAVLLGDVPGVSGSGTIAYIRWTVVRYGSSKIHFGIPGVDHSWWDCMLLNSNVEEIEFDMVDGYFSVSAGVEESKAESQNLKAEILEIYPNPFSRTTEIRIQKTEDRLPEVRNQKSDVRLMIYDLTGRLVRTFPISNFQFPISNSVVWDGTADDGNRLPSGIYFCKLQVGNESLTKQVFLLR